MAERRFRRQATSEMRKEYSSPSSRLLRSFLVEAVMHHHRHELVGLFHSLRHVEEMEVDMHKMRQDFEHEGIN